MSHLIRRRVMLGACCLLPLASAAAAQPGQYPDKPIRMIVAVPPGGPADTLSRLVSPKLTEAMGQAIVIDNRAGANGNIAYEMTARAVPDGYTFTAVAAGVAINPSLYREVKYDPVKDLAAITQGISVPNILVVHPSVPVQSVADLLAYAKARPGRLVFASAGNGTSVHMSAEMFKSMTGTDMVHVPYKGVAPAMTDLISGQIQLIFSDATSAIPQVKAGKIRAVAVTKPVEATPEVPTFAQSGFPSYDPTVWYGVFAPAGTPRDVVQKLNAGIHKALQVPEVRERLLGLGAQPAANSPEEFAEFVRAEIPRWGKVVKSSGATVD